jgi:WD40 repeat protein
MNDDDEQEEWSLRPSVTGHFAAVSDMDFHPGGHFIVTTSADQTTRCWARWGPNRWHEIGRPQIHGHDLFAVKSSRDFIVSGAEEKILRAFQPTEGFMANLEEVSEVSLQFENGEWILNCFANILSFFNPEPPTLRFSLGNRWILRHKGFFTDFLLELPD